MATSIIHIQFKVFIDRKATPIDGKWAFTPVGNLAIRETQFQGDCRTFAQPGSSRLMHDILFKRSQIGWLDKKLPFNQWIKSSVGMSRQRDRSRESVVGEWSRWHYEPPRRGADRSSIQEVHACSIQVHGSAAYPYDALAPTIDYDLSIAAFRVKDQLRLSINGRHDAFPFYELIVNGQSWYRFSPSDSGPGLINLNWSKSFQVERRI